MYKKIRNKKGFSLAEAMITLMIISLILAAVIPVMSRRQLTSDSMWKYAGNNSDIYYGEGASQAAIIGANSVPSSSNGAKMVIVTHADNSGDTIKRSLIDFYQKTSTGIKNIGKISFDESYGNVGIGKGVFANTTSSGTTTGVYNTAVGEMVLNKNTTGSTNTGVGRYVLSINTSGVANTAVGCQALYGNTSGQLNTAVGASALSSNQTGGYNTAVGFRSLMDNTTASGNTAVGEDSLRGNKTGGINTAVGNDAMEKNYSGSNNVAIGGTALYSNKSGHQNVAIGNQALYWQENSSQQTAVGYQALCNNKSEASLANTAVGFQALYNNSSGQENVAVGHRALQANTTGIKNVAIGQDAMLVSQTGSQNVGMGDDVLYTLKIGSANTAVGTAALKAVVNGANNVALGYFAGPTIDTSNQLFIDNRQTNAPLIWGDFNARQIKINGALFTSSGSLSGSDAALKNIGKEYKTGLENILKIKVKNYTYKNDKTKRLHHGVIAQELQKIMPDAIVKGPQDKLFVDTNEIVFSLVNAVKQLHTKLINVINTVSRLEAENKNLKQKNTELEKRLNNLESRLKKIESKTL